MPCSRHTPRAIAAHNRVIIFPTRTRIELLTIPDKCVRAYEHRRASESLKFASFTEILFDDALKQANELDAYFKEHGRLVGPLHGVPMTLKDQFDVKGYDSTLGYVGRALKPAEQDCVLVTLLKRMGAVIIAKTNLPQSIMASRHPRHRSSYLH